MAFRPTEGQSVATLPQGSHVNLLSDRKRVVHPDAEVADSAFDLGMAEQHGPILSIAGLWDEWTNPETGKPLKSCTMIITEPNKVAAKVHDRMPVLLSPDQFEPWLSGKTGTEMLKPAPDKMIVMHPVSKRVNSSRADDSDATLIETMQ